MLMMLKGNARVSDKQRKVLAIFYLLPYLILLKFCDANRTAIQPVVTLHYISITSLDKCAVFLIHSSVHSVTLVRKSFVKIELYFTINNKYAPS